MGPVDKWYTLWYFLLFDTDPIEAFQNTFIFSFYCILNRYHLGLESIHVNPLSPLAMILYFPRCSLEVKVQPEIAAAIKL